MRRIIQQTDAESIAGRGGGLRARAGDRPLGVAMVTALFPPSIGGIQSHTLALADRLAARGADVVVVTRLERSLARTERMRGVEVRRVGAVGVPAAAASVAFIAAAARELYALRRRVDVVHAHQLLSPTTAALLATAASGLPLVVNPHACGAIGDVGLLSRSALGRLRLAATLRRADAFVAVSRTIGQELVAAGAPARAVWQVENGVDTERFRPASADERRALRAGHGLTVDGPLVVYTGRLAREKGVDVLVEAWPELLRRVPAARLCVVGAGAEEGRLRALAASLGASATITFAGGVQDTAPYLRAADAAALPSRTEGMPVALLEAMACALPCVATAVGGSAELLADGVTGWLVPSERPPALAAALADALLEGAAGRSRGDAARAHVLAHHGLDAVAGRFLDLYRAVAAERAGARAPALAARR